MIESDLNKSQIIAEFGSGRDTKMLDTKIETMRSLIQHAHR